jgi:hypothetical protein
MNVLVLGSVVVASWGCELTEVTLVEFADIVVAEVYVSVVETPGDNRLSAFVHGTSSGAGPSSERFDDAVVRVTRASGSEATLGLSPIERCVADRPEGSDGSCFEASAVFLADVQPGEELRVEVTLGDGRSLLGVTRIPGAFEVDGVSSVCRVPPDTRLPLAWSRSDGAWAYLSEASITGLGAALAGEGIEAPDTLHLLGLSISEADTTVVFPNEFGVFDRFDLDRALTVRLQDGIPEGSSADVAIVAVDRNYANWVRGGSFNPSGAVRVSSLTGDGSGVFGASVTRRFRLVSTSDATAAPGCGGG